MSVKNVIRDNYNIMLLRDYLRDVIKDAGFSHVDMAKTPTGTRVSLHVTRPGIVIGRKGVGIKELTEVLGTKFGLKNPQVAVVEIDKPELSPSVMCNRIATHISRGIAFRRATMWTLKQIMESGAMGVQITVSGKLRGDRSAFEKHTQGILPRAGHHAEVVVSEDIAHVKTPMGLIGVRIRIARKEKNVPEFEMKTPESIAKAAAASKQESVEAASKRPRDGSGRADRKRNPEGPKKAGGSQDVDGKQEEPQAPRKPGTESEQIAIEAEKMTKIETHEDKEEDLLK